MKTISIKYGGDKNHRTKIQRAHLVRAAYRLRITGKVTERGYLTGMTETLNSTNPVSGQIGIQIGSRYQFRFREVDHPGTLPPIKSRLE